MLDRAQQNKIDSYRHRGQMYSTLPKEVTALKLRKDHKVSDFPTSAMFLGIGHIRMPECSKASSKPIRTDIW
jgi:hypothetical protein